MPIPMLRSFVPGGAIGSEPLVFVEFTRIVTVCGAPPVLRAAIKAQAFAGTLPAEHTIALLLLSR